MTWRQPGDEPLSEPNDGYITYAYMRYSALVS